MQFNIKKEKKEYRGIKYKKLKVKETYEKFMKLTKKKIFANSITR